MQTKQQILLPLLLLVVAAGVISAVQLWQSDGSLAWFGAFLAAIALPTYMIGFVAMGGAARTSARLAALQVVVLVGVALSAYGAYDGYQARGPIALLPMIPALAGLSVLQWYIFVYSTYGRKKSDYVVPGRRLPTIEFETMDGARVSSLDFAGSRTLIVFSWICLA